MTSYLDTSVFASLALGGSLSSRARKWIDAAGGAIALSDWTLCEFSSALRVSERAGRISEAERERAEFGAGQWTGRSEPLAIVGADVRRARGMIDAFRAPLRAGDALHLAVAERFGLALATFDEGMRRAAREIGLAVEEL